MIETIYVERAVAEHPRTLALMQRFPKAHSIPIERYGELFNRRQQDFRLQKQKPALIVAEKHGKLVLPAPDSYGIGGSRNFYFSHLLNCPYDCRYCFLQGMYQSAHFVWFMNYESFQESIDEAMAESGSDTYFFSGYDGDSLALDSVTGFVDAFVPFFAARPRAYLELRTKSVAIRPLLAQAPADNIVVAFSFTPPAAARLESGVPPFEARLDAIRALARHGYRIGLRFDPLLYTRSYRTHYRELFESVFRVVDTGWLHSVSFGPFRTPKPFFQKMERLYPEEPLFAGMTEQSGMMSYSEDLEAELRGFCEDSLSRFVPPSALFPCRI